jgi:hypothetical protein
MSRILQHLRILPSSSIIFRIQLEKPDIHSLCSENLVVTVLFMDLCHGMMICERSKDDGASNNTAAAAAVHQQKWTHLTMIITIRMTPTVKRKHQRFSMVTNVTDFCLGMPQNFIAPSLAFQNDVLRFYLGQTASTNCFSLQIDYISIDYLLGSTITL